MEHCPQLCQIAIGMNCYIYIYLYVYTSTCIDIYIYITLMLTPNVILKCCLMMNDIGIWFDSVMPGNSTKNDLNPLQIAIFHSYVELPEGKMLKSEKHAVTVKEKVLYCYYVFITSFGLYVCYYLHPMCVLLSTWSALAFNQKCDQVIN